MPIIFLVTAILFAAAVLWLLTGASSDLVVLLMVLGSVPILIGLISQRMKGRTGAAWWFLSLEVIFCIFLFFAAFLTGVIEPGKKPLLVGLSGIILFGAMPLVIVMATRPRRKVMQQFKPSLEQSPHTPN
jgi:hypothetical protein